MARRSFAASAEKSGAWMNWTSAGQAGGSSIAAAYGLSRWPQHMGEFAPICSETSRHFDCNGHIGLNNFL